MSFFSLFLDNMKKYESYIPNDHKQQNNLKEAGTHSFILAGPVICQNATPDEGVKTNKTWRVSGCIHMQLPFVSVFFPYI